LHLKLELIRKLRCRTAVRSQYRRRLHPGGNIDRVNEKAVHFGAVFAFEFCFLNAREFLSISASEGRMAGRTLILWKSR